MVARGRLIAASLEAANTSYSEAENVCRDPRIGNELSVWPSQFIERFVNESGLDIDDVDGALLELAVS